MANENQADFVPGRLAGKVALVTGAGRGIGKAIASRLVREGAAVGVLDIKQALAEESAADLAADAPDRVLALEGDVSKRETFVAAIDSLVKRFGRLDILVNNASWVRYGPIEEINGATLERMVGSGFNSVVWGTQIAAAQMKANGGGSIINIASVAGYLGLPNAMIYCGIKAGVMGLTRSAATDLGEHGIRVNAIAPGSVPTEGAIINVDAERIAARVQRTPMRRLGTVEDIAAAASFLACADSNFITGEVLSVDGGITHAFS